MQKKAAFFDPALQTSICYRPMPNRADLEKELKAQGLLSTNPKKNKLFHPKMLDLLYELLQKKPAPPAAPVVPEISVVQEM